MLYFSVASERVFSRAGNLLTKKKARMKGENANLIIRTSANLE